MVPPMKPLTLLVVIAAVLALAPQALSAHRINRQTPRRAELNLLQSPGILSRWSSSLVDPATRLLRPNTVVHCVGTGTSVRGTYHTLSCSITRSPARVSLSYIALGRYGFLARHVHVTRT